MGTTISLAAFLEDGKYVTEPKHHISGQTRQYLELEFNKVDHL